VLTVFNVLNQGKLKEHFLQKFFLLFAAFCLAGAFFTSSASARTTTWSGTKFYTGETLMVFPQTLILPAVRGRVRIKSMQLIMACSGGSNPEIAFDVVNGPTVNLASNRFRFNFTRSSNGRIGQISLRGRLGSNSRGTALVQISTVPRIGDSERCTASVGFSNLRRAR